MKISKALELLGQGASCNIQDHDGQTPLHVAVNFPPEEVVVRVIPEMLRHGASCNIQDYKGQTPLHFAIECLQKQDIDAMKLILHMLEFGADCNVQDHSGNTPLHRAFDCEAIKCMIANGAVINTQNNL